MHILVTGGTGHSYQSIDGDIEDATTGGLLQVGDNYGVIIQTTPQPKTQFSWSK